MRRILVCLVVVTLLFAVIAVGAAVKTYQVTGPVLEVRSDAIVVQKGKDRWELARDANTKVNGNLKVGAKVTIDYRMTATNIVVK
jgi:cell division protein FtsL